MRRGEGDAAGSSERRAGQTKQPRARAKPRPRKDGQRKRRAGSGARCLKVVSRPLNGPFELGLQATAPEDAHLR